MILVGSILKRHPVSDMSRQEGYNTPSSRKSQAHWDYAQSIAPDIFIKSGKLLVAVLLIYNALMLFMKINIDISVYIGMAIGFVFAIAAFFKVERQIKAFTTNV